MASLNHWPFFKYGPLFVSKGDRTLLYSTSRLEFVEGEVAH